MHERLIEVMPSLHPLTRARILLFLTAMLLLMFASANQALAHAVAEGDKGYIQEISGINIIPFMYLGAPCM